MQVLNVHRQRVCFGLVVGTLLAGVSVQSAYGEETDRKYTLQYKFLAAKRVSYTVENQSEVELHQGEAEQEVEHTEMTDKHYRVVSVDLKGNCVLELAIDRVQMSASVDGGDSVEFDSLKGEAPPPQFEGVADQIGKPHVRIKVSPAGEVLSLEWLQQADTQTLTAKNAGNLDILVCLPNEPVAVGDVWKERFETDIALGDGLNKAVTMQRTYKLKAVDGNIATIRLDTSVITPLRDPEHEAQLIQKTPNGDIKFDIDRGILLSRETKLDRKIVGFAGPKSFIRNVTSRKERYVETGPAGAIRQARDAKGVQR